MVARLKRRDGRINHDRAKSRRPDKNRKRILTVQGHDPLERFLFTVSPVTTGSTMY